MKPQKSQQGISLVVTFLVMSVILAIVLSVSTILFNEVRIVTGVSNYVSAFFVADSGTEQALYYDRKQLTIGANRGICNVCSVCPTDSSDPNGDAGTHCNSCTISGAGCGVSSCNADCTAAFSANVNGQVRSVTATLGSSGFTVNSQGTVSDVSRQAQVQSQ